MSTDPEDQEIMARISRLAGQINRAKSQQAGIAPAPGRRSSYRKATATHPGPAPRLTLVKETGYSAPASRRGSYPYPRGGRVLHRNRTLVLNNSSSQPRPSETESETDPQSSSPSSMWVTKHDRHLQLINSSVYEKEAQSRMAAMEQTRRQTLASKNNQENARFMGYLSGMATSGALNKANSQVAGKYEVVVQGIRFVVAKNGFKLIRDPGIDNQPNQVTPKTAIVGGVKFYRSKHGNLYRRSIVKAQRQTGHVRKVNVPCRQFSMTGSCIQGPRCRYQHDPDKVAICKEYLQQGECPSGENCDLSHNAVPERTPTCLHFARDSCTKPDCRYAHVKVSPASPVCRSFGFYGYCDKGAACLDRHVFECPDFSNTGMCKNKGCKLPHRQRASVLRKAKEASSGDVEMSDVSSDESEPVDSDDADSDEVDEFIGQDEGGGIDPAEQRDYIEF